MKIKYLVAISTFALMASGGTQAADIINSHVETAVVSVPAFSWEGLYAGGEIGGSWARSKVHAWSSSGGGNERWSTKPDGFIGGLYAGYNFDVGNNIILGIDTDFLWVDVNGTSTNRYEVGNIQARVKQKWVGSTRVRVGYAADRWLPYVAGGIAYSRIDGGAYVFSNTGARINENSESRTLSGWTLGTGVDYAMTDNVLLRLEYRYTDFGKKIYNIAGLGDTRVNYRANDFRVGVAYKF